MTDLALRPATELLDLLRRREVSARELLEHHLDRVAARDPAVNAVVTLDVDRARAAAEAHDRGSGSAGPLAGLPMTVKDTFETAGLRTTAGAPEWADHVPSEDAEAVRRLRAAGAIVFGKTNTPAYAVDVQTHNEVFGTTNNPWALDRSPGGSSGGSAAAVAAGLTPLELGSDIGGSLRNPASYCGVCAHKPTFGLVPLRGHLPGPPGTLGVTDISVAGPLARTPADLALVLDVLVGSGDAGRRLELPPPRSGRRVAAWLDDPACPVDSTVRSALDGAVAALRGAGVSVDETARPGFTFAEARDLFLTLLNSALSSGASDEDYARMLAVDPARTDAAARHARDVTMSHRDWLRADERRARLRARWAEFFASYDALLMPVTPTAALPHLPNDPRRIEVDGQRRPYWDQVHWVGLPGVAYLPVTVVPVGRTPEGLPVGVQVVGPHGEDRTPLVIAGELSDLLGGWTPPPLAL